VTIPPYPHGRPKPRLTDLQRWELAGASLTNALGLRDDAVVLSEAGRLQRSAFLLQACLEEVLKAYLCLTREPKNDQEWDRFWETFRDHRRKLALSKETEPGSSEAHDAGNRALRTLRERNLYVEVSDVGDPLTPMGLVDPGEMSPEGVELLYQAVNTRLGAELNRLREAEGDMKGGNGP
jgi:AbiV family abortive infection protein